MITSNIMTSLVRWFRAPVVVAAMIAALLLTAVVGGLTVWANWNPQGATSKIPAAVVNEDQSVTNAGVTIDLGNQIAGRLGESKSLDWQQMSAADAQQGLADGSIDAVLTLPADLSATIATLDTAQPRQATVRLVTNDATNYLTAAIAEQALRGVAKQVNDQLQLNFLNQVYDAIPGAREQGASAAATSAQLAQQVTASAATAQQVADGAALVASGVSQASQSAAAAATATKALAAPASAIATSSQEGAASATSILAGAKAVDASLATIQTELTNRGITDLAASVGAARTNLTGTVINPATALAPKLTQTAGQARTLATDAGAAATKSDQTAAQLAQLTTQSQQVADTSKQLATSLATVVSPGANELASSLAGAAAKVPPVSNAQREAFTDVLGEPVVVKQERENAVAYAGEGFAPILLSVAMFLGAIAVFLLLRPFGRRMLDHGFSAWQAVASAWVPAAVWGAVQAVLLVTVVVLAVGVRSAAWLPFLGVLVVSTVCFLAIAQLLRAAFGVTGVIIALGFLVLQMTASAGTYPTAMLGGFFRLLHPVMPMTYSVDGLRRTIAGGALSPYVWVDVLVLLVVAAICIAATVGVAARRRRLTPTSFSPVAQPG